MISYDRDSASEQFSLVIASLCLQLEIKNFLNSARNTTKLSSNLLKLSSNIQALIIAIEMDLSLEDLIKKNKNLKNVGPKNR